MAYNWFIDIKCTLLILFMLVTAIHPIQKNILLGQFLYAFQLPGGPALPMEQKSISIGFWLIMSWMVCMSRIMLLIGPREIWMKF